MLSFEIISNDQENTVKFKGPINEEAAAPLSQLTKDAANLKALCFDMEGIEYVNSLGIRTWINFMRPFSEGKTITMINCPPDVIVQINMIPKFSGGAKVESFFGFYICPSCSHEQTQKFMSSEGFDSIMDQNDDVKCASCGEATEMEVDEETFFDFLNAS